MSAFGLDVNPVLFFIAGLLAFMSVLAIFFAIYYKTKIYCQKRNKKKTKKKRPKYVINTNDYILPYYQQQSHSHEYTQHYNNKMPRLQSYKGKIVRHGMTMTPVDGKNIIIRLDSV